MPCLDGAATIRRAIDSLRAQTERDWELIVVVDGVGDEGAARIGAIAAIDPRIRTINLGFNAGPAAARNRGIADARGDWLMFLDDDDTVSPSFMRRMLRAAVDPSGDEAPDCVVTGFVRLSETGRVLARMPAPQIEDDPLAFCALGPPAAIHCFLTRRETIVAIGGFDETLRVGEDWDLWLRLAQSGARFRRVPGLLAQYRTEGPSLSSDGPTMLRDFGELLRKADSRLDDSVIDRQSIADQLLLSCFWSAGVAMGLGRSVDELASQVPACADWRGLSDLCALRLIDGLVVGSRVPWHGQYRVWPDHRDAFERLVAQLGAHFTGFDGFAVRQAIEAHILRAGHYRGVQRFTHVAGMPLSPARLWHGTDSPDERELIILRIPWLRPSTQFSFPMVAAGPVRGAEMLGAVRHVIGQRIGEAIASHPVAESPRARSARLFRAGRRKLGWPMTDRAPARVTAGVAARAAMLEAQAAADPVIAALPVAAPPPEAPPHPATGAGFAEWEAFFASEDPWDYDNAYEQVKYRRTIELIEAGVTRRPARALEIACAEGRFTAMLAPLCERLTASDISQTALDRAAARNAQADNIDYLQRDAFRDGVPDGYDLITCSEVLYYLPPGAPLSRFAGQVAAALNPGGSFVHAHAYQLVDTPGRTAFDWNDSVGAQTIFEAFRDAPGLTHRRTIETELYRIDLFEKGQAGQAVVERVPLESPLPDAVAGSVVWNGAIRTRAEAAAEVALRLPVLRLPIPADDGEAASLAHRLRFLRRRGFHSVRLDEWDEQARLSGAMRGKPVLLAIDCADPFAARASRSLIERNGFAATLLVPAARITDPAAWREVAEMVEAGAEVASTLDGMNPATMATGTELAALAVRSRAILAHVSGYEVTSVAPPRGISDHRIAQWLVAAGYRRILVDGDMAAAVTGNRLRTPMMAVDLAQPIETFAAIVGAADTPPDAGDLP